MIPYSYSYDMQRLAGSSPPSYQLSLWLLQGQFLWQFLWLFLRHAVAGWLAGLS